MRIGLGEDTHRLRGGGPLRLGGVDITHDRQTVGHSDADVLLHAVTDALLGAAGLADIGQMFPNTAKENRGRDSAEMLRLAHDEVTQAGYCVLNLDCVVAAEQPKLAPHKQRIRQRIADILSLTIEQINVKAKTGEGVGPIGEQLAIEARCVVLIDNISSSSVSSSSGNSLSRGHGPSDH